MNIGIDCLALPVNFSGAANYIINLSRNLLTSDRYYNLQVYCRKEHSYLFKRQLRPGDILIEIKLKNRFHKLLYYEKFLWKKLISHNTDVFLATHYVTPKAHPKYKIISVFHDMGFILHKEYYPLLKRIYFNTMIPHFIRRSNKIITVSRSTLKDLNSTFAESRSRSIYIYPGTDHLQEDKFRISKSSAQDKPYILAVNSLEKRKNIVFIIDIFNILKQHYNINHSLVLVGWKNNGFKEVKLACKHSAYKEAIFLRHDVSFHELKTLYQQADLFINASNYEGFGFTPLEAISQGCPAFLFSNNICQELFNNHPYLIDSTDPHIWAQKIYSEMRNNFKNKISYDKLSGLTWQKCAFNFNSLFHSLKGLSNGQRSRSDHSGPYPQLWQRSQ